jgi:hypothetical protein
VIETVVVHLLLYNHSRTTAWLLTILSAWAIIWLARDYRALGVGALSVDNQDVHLVIGHRYSVRVPRDNIASGSQPPVRDLPTPGTNEGRDYLNLLKPATPNVLLTLREPIRVRTPGGLHRMAARLGLHLDDAGTFIETMRQ